jgi:hypothetical protein
MVVTHFFATMSLSDSLWAAPRLWIPASRWVAPPRRVSQVPRLICPRALLPTTPESLDRCVLFAFPASVRLPPHRGTGHSHLANEAESDSLSLRLTGSLVRGFTGLDSSTLCSHGYMLKEQLHGGLLSFH